MTINAGEYVKKLKHIEYWCEKQSFTVTFENCLVVFYKVKHILIIWNPTPRYLFKRNGKTFADKNLYTNVFIDFINNSQELGISQMSSSGWMDKLWYISCNVILLCNKKEKTTDTTQINLKCIMLSGRY